MSYWSRHDAAKRAKKAVVWNRDEFLLRLRGMAADDPFWTQFIALLDAEIEAEQGAVVSHGLDDAEAHRLRGKLGKAIEFRDAMRSMWNTAHPPKMPKPEPE